MPPSNDILAAVYDENYQQIIVVFPLIWKHTEFGDWWLSGMLE